VAFKWYPSALDVETFYTHNRIFIITASLERAGKKIKGEH